VCLVLIAQGGGTDGDFVAVAKDDGALDFHTIVDGPIRRMAIVQHKAIALLDDQGVPSRYIAVLQVDVVVQVAADAGGPVQWEAGACQKIGRRGLHHKQAGDWASFGGWFLWLRLGSGRLCGRSSGITLDGE